MHRYLIAACALAVATACDPSPPASYAGADTGLAVARSRRAKDSLIILKDSLLGARARQLSVQSQLIGDAATSARLVSEIDRELSRARIVVKNSRPTSESGIQSLSDQLALVQRKVQTAIGRLNASEARVRQMRKDSVASAELGATQAAQLAEYERSIADLRSTVDLQAQEIAMLTARVDSLSVVNVALTHRNDTLSARNVALAAHDDSVYVAIGTEKELSEKGIIRREGGVWLLFGRGKTMVPARSFDPSDFQVLSRKDDLTIELPRSDKEYRVVSRQSLEYTDATNPKDPLVRGALHVTDPDQFWAPSRFLILVQR